MNDQHSTILKAGMRKLGNTFFYVGTALFALSAILVLIGYKENLTLGFTITALGAVIAFCYGGWFAISALGRRYKVLENLERVKVA